MYNTGFCHYCTTLTKFRNSNPKKTDLHEKGKKILYMNNYE